jgi:hypothetical protein
MQAPLIKKLGIVCRQEKRKIPQHKPWDNSALKESAKRLKQ